MELRSPETPSFSAVDLASLSSKSTTAASSSSFVETTGMGGAFDARGTTGVGARWGPAKYAPPRYPSG